MGCEVADEDPEAAGAVEGATGAARCAYEARGMVSEDLQCCARVIGHSSEGRKTG